MKNFLLLNIESSGQPGTRYLSKFSGSSSVLIKTPTRKIILTDGRYTDQARLEAPEWEVRTIDRSGYLANVIATLKELKIAKIELDSERTSHELVRRLSDFEIIAKPNFLQELRITKAEDQVAKIKASAQVAISAFTKLHIKAGMTERQVATELEYLMRREGADGIAFDTIVVSGTRTALPHGKPTDKTLANGELVTIDFGCFKDGYACDITRTIALGEVSPKLREIYDVVHEAQARGCKAIKAGITGREVDAVCRDYITERGYGEYFIHGTGHGLGMEVHELPYINHSNDTPLPVGAVITCEPGIYIEGLGGVRIEDDLVVTVEGSINLTSSLVASPPPMPAQRPSS